MTAQENNTLNVRYCLSALAQGFKFYSQVFPNPPVGALVVRDGKILAKGAHQKAGTAHAEVNAIEKAGARSVGSDLYVSLEPCNHFGRTPPCTELILKAGIKRVFYLVKDNTEAGGGADYLMSRGVELHKVQSSPQILRYLEPWERYQRDGIKTLTPIFSLDLSGSLIKLPTPELFRFISKRFQRVFSLGEDLATVNAYDLSYFIQDKNDLSYFLNVKANKLVSIPKIMIVRSSQYSKSEINQSDSVSFEEFRTLKLLNAHFFRGVCLEEYEVTYV